MGLFVDIEKTLGTFHLQSQFETDGGVMALLGASGCGKSMTLRCIAGIERPDRGRIVLDGVVLYDSAKHIALSPQRRRVGYLFQQYALFPNMTVRQNILTGVRTRKNADSVVSGILRTMHLEDDAGKRPYQLSGGQQQRVALARILVNEPNALLLDEPFSALDSHLRFQMEQEVRDTIQRFGKTVLLVSHNRDEVFRLSDNIAILRDGVIETHGDKQSVFADPLTRNGAILTGCKNLSRAEVRDEHHIFAVDWGLELTVSRSVAASVCFVGMRMHDVQSGDGENAVRCRVAEVIENPFSYTVMALPIGVDGATPIGWELDKPTWNRLCAEELTIRLPSEALLPLKA